MGNAKKYQILKCDVEYDQKVAEMEWLDLMLFLKIS